MNNRQNSLFFIFHFSFLIILLSLSSCADIFQPKIPMSGNNDTLDNVFGRNAEEITQLSTPTQFYIAPYYSSSEIRLTWSAVRGAEYYMVERAVSTSGEEPDDGEYEPLERFVYGTSYTDEVLRTPSLDSPEFQNKYFYRVSAFNTAKKYDESEPTIPQSAMLFRAPAKLKASGGESVEDIMVEWESTPGAVSYEIWRSTIAEGTSPTLLKTVYGNQVWYRNMVSLNEQGVDFYYMITAINSFGKRTQQTRPAYGYSRVFGAPTAPENINMASDSGRGNSTTGIEIQWDAVDAEGVYYAIYRYSEFDSSLTKLESKFENTSGALIVTYNDTQGLKPGIYYYYKIQAILLNDDGKELKSSFSKSDPEGYLLSCPDEVIAEKNPDGSVTVKWKPAKGSEGERLRYTYNVWADSDPEGSFVNRVAASVPPDTGGDGYISTSVLSGAFFKVSTMNGGDESAKSVVVSPSPAAAIIDGATQRANTGATANSNGVYPVKITWRKPDNEEPYFYNIQRSTRSGSGYSTINDESLPAGGPFNDVYYREGDIYTYIDKNESARVGRKFYYRVLSLNLLKQGSFPSGEREGYGALTHTQYLLEYNKTMSAALKKLTYMWKPGSTDKLGTETKNGSISGTIYYNAALDGLGARIIIRLSNYADFYIENVPANGVYFILSGESNTSANMSSNGTMDGTVTCTGMYPGSVRYNNIQIKGGGAGGGTYGVQPEGFPNVEVVYTVIN